MSTIANAPAFGSPQSSGITAREWFAGMAMASGDLPCRMEAAHGEVRKGTFAEQVAEDAFWVADAMIAESARKRDT